ncbi:MAG: prolyl oligopeptidase family serine peptidase [Treponema sp.]|nr:prolyl oligopeptidase family serine peptidase [Treponema sp.]
MLQIILSVGFCVLMLGVMVAVRIWQKKSIKKIYEDLKEKDYSYTLLIKGCDWGPAVDRMILAPGNHFDEFKPEDFDPKKFSVTVSTERYLENGKLDYFTKQVEVTDACPCDIDGNPLEGFDEAEEEGDDEPGGLNGGHILLTLKYGPKMGEINPFAYNFKTQQNNWKDKFDFTVEHPKLPEPIKVCSDWYCKEAQQFDDIKTGNELTATSWCPPSDGKKHPLIVWLHGAGEGGTDPMIALLGNKVTALVEPEIQSYFDGAYVLCPQNPTVWMQQGNTPYDILQQDSPNHVSKYTHSCKKVIDSFISKHDDIDRNRIYIGGCSNGGYMTINMLLNYPNFFAAAFPVCEAYSDSWLGDNDIKALGKVPLWFVAAKNDVTVDPEKHMIPTVRRCLELNGGSNVRMSLFDDVHNSFGEYFGHWSWIYLFNNECVSEDEEVLWEWISEKELMEDSSK